MSIWRSRCRRWTDGDLLWIGLHEPTAATSSTPIEAQLGLHPLAVEDALDHRHLPKIEPFGDHLFTVARTVHLDDERAARPGLPTATPRYSWGATSS